ncbi:hypothetical protein D3C84_1132290 [compost metagenome]
MITEVDRGQYRYANEIPHVVDQYRRHQHEFDRITIHHRVAGDESAGQQAVENADMHAPALRRVFGREKQFGAAGNQEDTEYDTRYTSHA